MPTSPVALLTAQPRPTAVIAATTSWGEFPSLWPKLLDEVYGFVRPRPELATGAGGERWQNVMLYLDDRPAVEIGVLAATSFAGDGRVTPSHLPGGTVATAVHRGDYAQLGDTHATVRARVADLGRELAGPLWEIYGHWREDPSQLETEIFYLLR